MASMDLPLPSNPLEEEIRRRLAAEEQERLALASMLDPDAALTQAARLKTPGLRRQPRAKSPVPDLTSAETPLRILNAPAAGTGAGAGYLLDHPGDTVGALGAGLRAGIAAPTTPLEEQTDIAKELERREIPIPGGMASKLWLGLAGDPTNWIGGDPSDLLKAGVGFGAVGARGLRKGGKLLASELKGPALATSLASEARFPETTRAMLKPESAVSAPGAAVQHPLYPPEKGDVGWTGKRLSTWTGALDNMANDIHARTLAGGSTTHPLTGEVIEPGDPAFMTGKYSNQSGKTAIVPLETFRDPKKGRAIVRAFMETHADEFAKNPEAKLGTWIGTGKDGQQKVFLDVSQRYDTARQATVAGMYQRQPAIDPTTGQPVVRDPDTGEWPKAQENIFDALTGGTDMDRAFPPVGNFAEFLQTPEFAGRVNEMYDVGEKVMRDLGQPDWWDLYGSSLERVYGKERIKPLAGLLAVTSGGSPPVENLRAASEYLRRLIKNEPLIQPDFTIPETAAGGLYMTEGGDPLLASSIRPGARLPKEATRVPNLQRVGEGRYSDIQLDKMNDMYHALTGEDVAVFDRHWAKIAEAPERGIYADSGANLLSPSMESGNVGSYALIENAVRDIAKARGIPLRTFSAAAWEGIRDTIRRTGQLFGTEFKADAIPDIVGGFPAIFDRLVAEKAKAWGISVAELEKRLRSGDAELLTAILTASAGAGAYQQSRQGGQTTSSSPTRREAPQYGGLVQ